MLKKLLASLVLITSFAVSGKATTLYPDGVLAGDGVTLTSLQADGWSVEFMQAFYSGPITQLDISQWITDAGVGGYVFVGGLDADGNVVLGATGLAGEVLSQTSSSSVGTLYSSSNLYWYNNAHPISLSDPVGSMGFSKDSNINLFEADTASSNAAYRLSWHTNFSGGGYRPGVEEKVVLIWSGASSVPDSGTSVALLGVGLVAVAALRRRLA